jgi:hypothetical protein
LVHICVTSAVRTTPHRHNTLESARREEVGSAFLEQFWINAMATVIERSVDAFQEIHEGAAAVPAPEILSATSLDAIR